MDGLLALAVQAASLTVRMSPYVQAVQVINDLTVAALPDGVMIELGSLYAGETRRLILTLAVPGVPTLGLAEIATLELGYVALPALEQQTITLPLHVNVVPGDQAAGRIPDPVVRTEAAFQRAQQAKREASSAWSAGDARSAAARAGSCPDSAAHSHGCCAGADGCRAAGGSAWSSGWRTSPYTATRPAQPK